MSRHISIEVHVDRHGKMLEYQKQIAPFTPTIRDLEELWDVRSTAVVVGTLKHLGDWGMVIVRQHGETKSYYAVRRGEPG